MPDGLLQPNFSAASALSYGKLIEIAYSIYEGAKGNPTPEPPKIDGFDFVAWVTMRDFVLTRGEPEFYGFLVESIPDPRQFIMVIRGTSNLAEWWDDLLSIRLAPWREVGQVGYGFAQIYSTLKLHMKEPVDGAADAAPAEAGAAPAQALAPTTPEPFARQVARAAHRHRAARAAPTLTPAMASIDVNVAGHSLGSALATLYVAENALLKAAAAGAADSNIHTPLLYTFASPRVGDPTFAAYFDALPVTAWRLVNELDLVPKVPVIGFQHVREQQLYNSGTQVTWTLGCWHAMTTYLHLIDSSYPLGSGCQWSWARTGAMARRGGAPDAGAPLLPAAPDARPV